MVGNQPLEKRVKNPKILLIGGSDYYPSDRFRLLQYIPYLIAEGFNVRFIRAIPNLYFKPRYNSRILYWGIIFITRFLRDALYAVRILLIKKGSYRYIFINRPLIPYGKIRLYEKKIFNKKIPIVFDFDDALYLDDYLRPKLEFYISRATKVTAANKILAHYSRNINTATYILPTVIDHQKYTKKEKEINSNDVITFGWIGSFDAMRFALPAIKNALEKININPKFRFVIISDKKPTPELITIPYTFFKWTHESEIFLLKIFDIGLMPLADNKFQEAKSGAKLLQYMGIGIPSIATPLGVNKEIVKNYINGFLAIDEDEWYNIMLDIINNKYDLKKISDAAYYTAHQYYSIKAILPKLIEILT